MKNAAHVVQQPRDGQHHCGRFQVVPAIQEELSVLVALGGGLGKPIVGLLTILSIQIQFAESVLGILVSGLSGLGEVLHRFVGVLSDDFAFELLFAQSVGRAIAPVVGGILQPLDSQIGVMHFWIIREVQLPKSILRWYMTLLG